jgi:hypothetical protein
MYAVCLSGHSRVELLEPVVGRPVTGQGADGA